MEKQLNEYYVFLLPKGDNIPLTGQVERFSVCVAESAHAALNHLIKTGEFDGSEEREYLVIQGEDRVFMADKTIGCLYEPKLRVIHPNPDATTEEKWAFSQQYRPSYWKVTKK